MTREDFLALVSHDLRSLSGIITMNLDMMDRQVQVGPAQVTRYSTSIKRATAQMKFTSAGGRISISVEPQGTDLCFSVTDSGEGIPPEKLGTIFDRYSQVNRWDQCGLGLGLYIARRLVRLTGGALGVDSTVGQGSSLFLSLPA